ncbi:MAG: transglutaminase-like domain-containing protein [Candidatus Acidiferrales bacterium]
MKRIAGILAVIFSVALISYARFSANTSTPVAQAVSSRSFTFAYISHVPAIPAGSHQLRIWLPLPYEDSSQKVSDIKIESPVRFKIEHEKEYNDRYGYFVVEPDDVKGPFDIRLTFHAQRLEHQVPLNSSDDPPARPLISPARFLMPDKLVPINGEIAQISEEQTRGAAEPVEKARRLYNYVIATMHYDHDGTGWGHGDAIWACDNKHGNCTDFHSLFIGMARAAGIPARFEIGFSIPAGEHDGPISGYHCWAEFYVQGIGWIPVDASEAWKNKDKRDYYFGTLDENRIMFTLGRDIRLKPGQKGDLLNYFVYPYAELDGKPLDGLKNEFSFRDDPVPAGTPTKISTSD